MNKLKLNFLKKKYPYTDELYDPNIIWGRISLNVNSPNGDLVKRVIEIEWDVRELTNWFVENKESVLCVEYPLKDNDNKYSIAQKVYNFYNIEQDLDEYLLDKVYGYRSTHGIRFALRGTDIEDIYIGRNNEKYEISFCNEDFSWVYHVDMNLFYDELDFILS